MNAPVIIDDVQVIDERDGNLLCRVREKEVLVPIADVGIADDAVSRPGQHGHLVVRLALAKALGLATPAA